MKKEQEARRAQHEKYLCQMRDEANVEIAMLKSSVVGEEGPSGAASDASFPDDPIEDINCLTPPIGCLKRNVNKDHKTSISSKR